MKSRIALSFWLAAALLVFAVPQSSRAQDMTSDSSAQAQTAQMVPAQAALATNLDAKTMQPGAQFQATLSEAVRLNDGTELPHDTRLIGTVTSDNMAPQGRATLALRFTQADLKDGKTIPIKAMIVDVDTAHSDIEDVPDTGTTPVPWDGKVAKIDQIGVVSGVDLHSNIDGNNSGVFVATKKDDVKLHAGSELSLAIGTQG